MAGYLKYFLCYCILYYHKVLSTSECTFLNGFCDWGHSKWTRTSIENIQDGDIQRRTDGKCIAITKKEEQGKEIKATLRSPKYTQRHCCFGFWYSIGGAKENVIKVNALRKKRIFSWRREELWFHAYVSLNMPEVFQIKIEGIIHEDNKGYVAVDDTVVTNGTFCPADCNFEYGFCAWEQEGKTDDFNWRRISGRTQTSGTGPTKDHTTGAGYYIYVEADKGSKNETARLSVLKEGGGKYCLIFWFNMHGDHVKSLKVYVTPLDTDSGQLVFSEQESTGMEWKEALVDIYQHNDHKISLEGVIGAGNKGDIAVDDITIRSGDCKQTEKPGSLTAVYVAVALIITTIVVISVALLFWRKRHAKDTKSSETPSGSEGQRNFSVTNKTYTDQNIENQKTPDHSEASNTASSESEYAVITDDKIGRADSNNVEYNTINANIEIHKDRDYGYDRLKPSLTPFVDKTYSRLLENDKDNHTGNDDAKKRLAASGKESIRENSDRTAGSEDISFGIAGKKRRLPFEIEDEPDVEYDHAEAGGLDQPFHKRDDYSHLHGSDCNKRIITDKLDTKLVNTNQKPTGTEKYSAEKEFENTDNVTDTQDPSYHDYFILEKEQ